MTMYSCKQIQRTL